MITTNVIELAVTLCITFQTNCMVNGSSRDGTLSSQCVVERVCKIDKDLGDGQRLMICVTNEIMRFNRSSRRMMHFHPILGMTEEEIDVRDSSSMAPAPPSPPLLPQVPPSQPNLLSPTVIPPPPPTLPPLPARSIP